MIPAAQADESTEPEPITILFSNTGMFKNAKQNLNNPEYKKKKKEVSNKGTQHRIKREWGEKREVVKSS